MPSYAVLGFKSLSRIGGHVGPSDSRQGAADKPLGAEADDEPRRQLTALALEEDLDTFAHTAETQLPEPPSPLWKRRTRYVRGAHPLHCSILRRGKPA